MTVSLKSGLRVPPSCLPSRALNGAIDVCAINACDQLTVFLYFLYLKQSGCWSSL